MTPDKVALYAAIGVAIGSELLAANPRIKANSWSQLVMAILRGLASNNNNAPR